METLNSSTLAHISSYISYDSLEPIWKQATPGTNVHSWYSIIYLHWYISYQKYSRYTSVITVSLNTTYLSHLEINFDKKQQTWISILRLVHAVTYTVLHTVEVWLQTMQLVLLR